MTLAPSPTSLQSNQTLAHLSSSSSHLSSSSSSPFSSPTSQLSRARKASASSPSITEITHKAFSEMVRECLEETPRGMSPSGLLLLGGGVKCLTPIRVYDLRDSPVLNLLINQLPSPKAPSSQEIPLFATLFHEPILQMLQKELFETNGNLNEISEDSLSSIISFANFINELNLTDVFKDEDDTDYVLDCLDQLTSSFSEVTSLSLEDHSHLGKEVMEIIAKWTKLEVLNLTNSVKLFAELPTLLNIHFENLTELFLGQNPSFLQSKVNDEDRIFCINDENLHFISKKFALSKLDISGAAITPASSFKLGNLTQITYLNLSNCVNLKSDTFAFARKLALLEEINLSGIGLTQEALFNVGGAKKIRKITISLDAIKKAHEGHPGFCLQQLISRFLSTYPHITLSVPPSESEQLKKIIDEHRAHIGRASRLPRAQLSLDLPDL